MSTAPSLAPSSAASPRTHVAGIPANPTAWAPTVPWNGGLQAEAVDLLRAEAGVVVCPTKVGYVIMATDRPGLVRKFAAKNRPRSKPGVVLCGSVEQLLALAEIHEEALDLYRVHDREDVLLGCILPWREEGRELLPEQHGARGISPAPALIRAGLGVDQIMHHLFERFPSWDHRHGQYH